MSIFIISLILNTFVLGIGLSVLRIFGFFLRKLIICQLFLVWQSLPLQQKLEQNDVVNSLKEPLRLEMISEFVNEVFSLKDSQKGEKFLFQSGKFQQ